jgi:hypothetical protein
MYIYIYTYISMHMVVFVYRSWGSLAALALCTHHFFYGKHTSYDLNAKQDTCSFRLIRYLNNYKLVLKKNAFLSSRLCVFFQNGPWNRTNIFSFSSAHKIQGVRACRLACVIRIEGIVPCKLEILVSSNKLLICQDLNSLADLLFFLR